MKIKFQNSYIDLESVLAITKHEDAISFEFLTGNTLVKEFMFNGVELFNINNEFIGNPSINYIEHLVRFYETKSPSSYFKNLLFLFQDTYNVVLKNENHFFEFIKPIKLKQDNFIDKEALELYSLSKEKFFIFSLSGKEYIIEKVEVDKYYTKYYKEPLSLILEERKEKLKDFHNMCDDVIGKWEKVKGVSSYLESI